MTTPAERRKQFAEVDAICALEGFTEADKSPQMIRRREAVIEGSMTTTEAVAEAVAEAIAKVKADKAKAEASATSADAP